MYAGMVRGRARVQGSRGRAARAAQRDVACFAAAIVGLRADDPVFGCRGDGVLEELWSLASLPRVADGVGRLYAAGGAAMTFRAGAERVAMAFFERHEAGGAAWGQALKAVAELPLVLVVLPRWTGAEDGELCPEARRAGVPRIAVDAADAIALYRVLQESLVRARMGGGAALIEGVWFAPAGQPKGDAVEGLEAYLRQRGIASRGWLLRAGSARASR